MTRIRDFVDRMRRAGWKPGPVVTLAEVDAAEMHLGVMLPPAYREFLVAAGRTPAETSWRGLWNVDDLISLNRSLPVFQWFGGLIGIANEGFTVHAMNYREPHVPVVMFGMSSSDWAEVSCVAASFEEWLEESLPPRPKPQCRSHVHASCRPASPDHSRTAAPFVNNLGCNRP